MLFFDVNVHIICFLPCRLNIVFLQCNFESIHLFSPCSVKQVYFLPRVTWKHWFFCFNPQIGDFFGVYYSNDCLFCWYPQNSRIFRHANSTQLTFCSLNFQFVFCLPCTFKLDCFFAVKAVTQLFLLLCSPNRADFIALRLTNRSPCCRVHTIAGFFVV